MKKTSDFYYELPENLIAQTPIEPRDSSRLLVLNKNSGNIEHKIFKDIPKYISPNDCLILNDSKVLPARIFGKKESGAIAEFLLLHQTENNCWESLAKPGKKAKKGDKFDFGEGLKSEILEVLENGNRILKFNTTGDFFVKLDKIGQMPLPPYIKEKLKDKSRYQTIYAKDLGSAAAPTAGLHFTKELMEKLKAQGVKIGFVTLHVGLGTFRPVKAKNISEHKMHSEFYSIPESTSNLINETKRQGGKVFCVGTTTCRTLEATAEKFGKIKAFSGSTNIFITPGFKFKVIDSIITNFHLPESTLIMLICAFAGYENTMKAYKEAVSKKYRFFSFGDAMLVDNT